MAQILTFLGKGGTGRTTVAIATAKAFAAQGKQVLLLGQGSDPSLSLLLETPLEGEAPQTVAANLQVIQLRATQLLEQNWQMLKQLETQYLQTPFFKSVFGQELGVLPGMDQALTLNALREYDSTGQYDVIVLDSDGDQNTLRMLGMPEILGWYVRRFRQVFAESDLGKTLAPFAGPIAGAVLNVSWSGNVLDQPAVSQMNNILEQGQAAIADPARIAAYLITTDSPLAIATARQLWGTAQQVGLTVGGVLLNQSSHLPPVSTSFAPLTVTSLPSVQPNQWQPLIDALPDFTSVLSAPRPITVDLAARQVSLFLPGFDKTQVKLSQSGPEVTIEAGDQRRNLMLPPELRGQAVTGAKFQDSYLILSF
jgi:anion-transporting  ArsA/GET3 family ATPase